MKVTYKDDFNKQVILEVTNINGRVCLFVTRDNRVYREVFTDNIAKQLSEALLNNIKEG